MVRRLCGILLVFLLVGVGLAVDREDAFIGYSENRRLGYGKTSPDPAAASFLVITTDFGTVKIELLEASAPATVKWIKSVLSSGKESAKVFYRAESMEEGYGLVQGRFWQDLPSPPLPAETSGHNVRKTAALITGTTEFFISLTDHSDWDGSFNVFGEVADDGGMEVLEKISHLPIKNFTHPDYGTVMRMLIEEVHFDAEIVS
ncbi:hypothetical protein BSKO_10800 [Bryopsis sp. KO-2023]|nr:hypothetical protein BSKO_10800 [Bryopsis sp. KO-2023]